MGYAVTLFDKNEDAGGLLRYGIPNFKLNKAIINRRMDILRAEGIEFKFNASVDLEHLPAQFDAFRRLCHSHGNARSPRPRGSRQGLKRNPLRPRHAIPTKPDTGRRGNP